LSDKSQFVIVSNRLPVHRVKRNRSDTWQTSPGGLVSAMKPILQQHPGNTWIGWAGDAGPAPKPFEHDGISNRPVGLSASEIQNFYEGFSNGTLWPLYHDAIRTPEYRRRWWWPYVDVNRRFAEVACQIVGKHGVVWVHDYHFQLVPAMIRDMRPDVRIGFFLHIPFPPQELFSQLPWRKEILEGLLGADVIGFQTRLGAQNFARLCKKFVGVTGARDLLEYRGRTVETTAFPISIDVDHLEKLVRSDSVIRRCQTYHSKLGPNRKIILGVDRMDYTKGIDIRLRAFQELLRSQRITVDECVMIQVATPSRERVAEYRQLRSEVERYVGEINGEFGELGRPAVYYLHRNLPIEELVAMYLAADVMLVTPLRDGMNLVAKEYVASRTNHTGALVLSEFAGAAKELRSALLFNPHDIDGLEAVIYTALNMPKNEQVRRMRSLRRVLKQHDIFHWANTFMNALKT